MYNTSTIGAGNRPSIGDLFMPKAWMLGVEEITDGNISKVSPTVDLFSWPNHPKMEAVLILFRTSNAAVYTLFG